MECFCLTNPSPLQKRLQGENTRVSDHRISSMDCGDFTNTNMAAPYKCVAGERNGVEAVEQLHSQFNF